MQRFIDREITVSRFAMSGDLKIVLFSFTLTAIRGERPLQVKARFR
jgi:hypothetical protein